MSDDDEGATRAVSKVATKRGANYSNDAALLHKLRELTAAGYDAQASDEAWLETLVVMAPELEIDDPEDDDFVAHFLLHVSYPSNYPLETTPPTIRILWHLVTQKSLVVTSNKPLESLAILQEEALFQAMSEEAQESLLGMPSVYELLDTWLTDHIFEFLQKR